MRASRTLAACVAAACGSPPRPPAVENRAVPPTLEAAIAAANGHGRARDYRAAAAIAGELCQAGCGALEPCRFYYDLARGDRGVELPAEQLAALAVRLCHRGVAVACVESAYGYTWTRRSAEATEQCEERGDRDACESAGMLSGSTDERETATLVACAHGAVAACEPVFTPMWNQCTGGGLSEPGEPCLDALVDRTQRSPRALRVTAAWHVATTACDAGDADACAAVPGRALSSKALCSAGDTPSCNLDRGRDSPYMQRRRDVSHADAERQNLGEACAGDNEQACARARALDPPCP